MKDKKYVFGLAISFISLFMILSISYLVDITIFNSLIFPTLIFMIFFSVCVTLVFIGIKLKFN